MVSVAVWVCSMIIDIELWMIRAAEKVKDDETAICGPKIMLERGNQKTIPTVSSWMIDEVIHSCNKSRAKNTTIDAIACGTDTSIFSCERRDWNRNALVRCLIRLLAASCLKKAHQKQRMCDKNHIKSRREDGQWKKRSRRWISSKANIRCAWKVQSDACINRSWGRRFWASARLFISGQALAKRPEFNLNTFHFAT